MAMIMHKDKPVKDKNGIINLDADGISLEDYMTAVRAIAAAINDIRDRHTWCWVWVKFAAALNPLITQGPKCPTQGNSLYVKVNEPRPEDRLPRDWFTEDGWETYNKDQGDGERMAELRRTYGRILKIVEEKHITLDEAQMIFKRAGLPQYDQGAQTWRGFAEIYTRSNLTSKDFEADKEKILTAWAEFLAKTGLKDYGGYPQFSKTGGDNAAINAKDIEPLIGNPMRNYDPMVLHDGTRLVDMR